MSKSNKILDLHFLCREQKIRTLCALDVIINTLIVSEGPGLIESQLN